MKKLLREIWQLEGALDAALIVSYLGIAIGTSLHWGSWQLTIGLMVLGVIIVVVIFFHGVRSKEKPEVYHCNMCRKDFPEEKMALHGTVCGKETNGICGECIVRHKDILFRGERKGEQLK